MLLQSTTACLSELRVTLPMLPTSTMSLASCSQCGFAYAKLPCVAAACDASFYGVEVHGRSSDTQGRQACVPWQDGSWHTYRHMRALSGEVSPKSAVHGPRAHPTTCLSTHHPMVLRGMAGVRIQGSDSFSPMVGCLLAYVSTTEWFDR